MDAKRGNTYKVSNFFKIIVDPTREKILLL